MFLVMLFIHVGKRLNSCWQMFFKTGVLKNFAIFTGKHHWWSLFLIKLQDWRSAFSLIKTLQHRCNPTNIAKFVKMDFLWNTCLLHVHFVFCVIITVTPLMLFPQIPNHFLSFRMVFPHVSTVSPLCFPHFLWQILWFSLLGMLAVAKTFYINHWQNFLLLKFKCRKTTSLATYTYGTPIE